ncbi:MAG: HipA domain-containing protein [Lachnospiraceae bacterium]|nr:HipA domain-containing protein [Lachnospiraceae bacterium]
MNCLCCGKPLKNASESGWHKNCIKRFFGTTVLPEIDISASNLEIIAGETVRKGLTVPGVQKKLSLHLFSDGKQPRLTLVNYPTGYILKPQVDDYRSMPESEHLVMSMADVCGIATVPHALIQNDGTVAYITKRVDRIIQGGHVTRLAMEDFCQLDLRLVQDKYRGSYERCSKVISRYSLRPLMDQTELFLRLVFCFLTGNSDMHLKNFSLIETAEGSGEYILSPAYDLLPVNLIMPQDKEEFALPMNGRKNNLRKKDFLIFAETGGIPKEAANKMILFLLSKKRRLLSLCAESWLPDDMKEIFAELIESRCAVLED